MADVISSAGIKAHLGSGGEVNVIIQAGLSLQRTMVGSKTPEAPENVIYIINIGYRNHIVR